MLTRGPHSQWALVFLEQTGSEGSQRAPEVANGGTWGAHRAAVARSAAGPDWSCSGQGSLPRPAWGIWATVAGVPGLGADQAPTHQGSPAWPTAALTCTTMRVLLSPLSESCSR